MKVNPEDLCANGDIARRLGIKPNVVSNWRVRHADTFPEPVAVLSSGPVWDWNDITVWIEQRVKAHRLVPIYSPEAGRALLTAVRGG